MSASITKKMLFLVFFVGVVVNSQAINDPINNKTVEELLEVDTLLNKAKDNFSNFVATLYQKANDSTLSYESFEEGIVGYMNMLKNHEVKKERYLTIIDFSKPSTEDRLYIFDACNQELVFSSIVAHGQNSGGLYAKKFSNTENSHQSSIGFYVTTTTYTSSKYKVALRLDGKEYTNSHASSRGIVMHGADYASEEYIHKYGRLGRSYGCPAMPYENFYKIVDWIKEGSCLYIYYPSQSYKRHSKYLNKKDYLADFLSV
ncbi:MAG: murein L,D-transpeptidase catalytic domain family protein [Putridiphycobacter sp.]